MNASYDPWLVLLSLLLSMGASYVALTIAARIPFVERKSLWLWLSGGAVSMGLSIWSMHFVGMLAYHIDIPLAYDVELTLRSILYAIAATALAFMITRLQYKNLLALMAAALFMGAGIAAMHYTGMQALKISPPIEYEPILFFSSLLIAFGASLIALKWFFITGDSEEITYRLFHKPRLVAALIMGVAIAGMHYTAMEAAIIAPGSECLALDGGISPGILSVLIVLGVIAVLLITLMLLILDIKLADKDRELLANLQQYNRRLEQRAQVLAQKITAEKSNLILMENVFKHSGEGIVITDADNRIVAINEAYSRITGYQPQDVIGKNPGITNSGRQDNDFFRCMWEQLTDSGHWSGEIWDKRKNGEIYPSILTITVITDDNDNIVNYIGIFTDIGQQKKHEAEIRYIADHDVLTGLPNRNLLKDRMKQAIILAKRKKHQVAIVFVDLDHFKNINDTLGHEIGDLLLKQVADRIQGATREMDTVSRFGGDEFLLFLPDIVNIQHVVTIAENIIRILSEPYILGDNTISVTPSIGISMYPEDATDCSQLIRNADTAMYHAKRLGRGNFQFFTASLNDALNERLAIEQGLQEALLHKQFSLHYQPQISLKEKAIKGVEALIRWTHPTLGTVSPDRFIPIAEETGMIHEIGNWVFDEACRTCTNWQNQFPDPIRISLNISVKQINHPDFFKHVIERISDHAIASGMLELEITESVLMDSVEHSLQAMEKLHELGISLAIDDFGTGYSSLSYLTKLKIDTLKIDRSFVKDLPANKESMSIIQAVVAMAHGLGLSVIAEGAETTEQVDYLESINCDEVQGYYFSKPLSEADVVEFIRQWILAGNSIAV